jgi:beta-exotoxin I transport system permease protein
MSAMMRKSLRDQRRSTVGWTIGIVGVALMYAAVYPSIKDSAAELRDYVSKLPDAIKTLIGGEDYTSPAGYLRSELFSTMGPLLFLIFAIGAGARATAGEEEHRTLDLLLSTPTRRDMVVADKALAALLTMIVLGAATFAAVALIGPLFSLTLPAADLAAGCVMLALLGAVFGSISLAVGAATGRRVLANAVAGGFAVVAFIVNALAPSVGWLEPLRPFSPVRWYLEPDPLTTGLHVANLIVLVGVMLAMYVIAHVTFLRRDLQS